MANLSQVVKQLQVERNKMQSEISKLDAAISALSNGATRSTSSSKPRRPMSVAARKRIAAAQRKRWKVWKAKQKKAA
jgi:hypothetical protein